MDKEIAIRVQNVNKTFMIHEDQKSSLRSLFASFFYQGKLRKFQPLRNINLEIHKGEFVGIMGKNGSGKSTLLKIIAGIFSPDKGGRVDYLGKLVPFLELGVGFNHDLSGRENIFLNGTILGMSRKFLESKFDEIVDFAEIREFIDTPVKNYSSGMIVRLAFSIAIQADADIYILDEILSVGDAGFQRKSLAMINEFKKQGKTILFVSHNTGAIAEFCNRAILINDSEIIADGDPLKVSEIYSELIIAAVNKANENSINNKEKPEIGTLLSNNNKENYIQKVTLTDGNSRKVTLYKRSDDIFMNIHTVMKDNNQKAHLNIRVHEHGKSVCIGSFNTYFDEVKLDLKQGANITQLRIANRFIRGKYFFKIELFSEDPSIGAYDTYDSRTEEVFLEVFGNDQISGLVKFDREWKLDN